MAEKRLVNEAVAKQQRRRYYNYDVEIQGNAVRKALPEILPEQQPQRKRATKEEIEAAQREANERAFGIGSFILTMAAVAFVCFALFLYLGERGELHSHTKVIKTLNTELNEKTMLNDNRLTAIEAGIDYTDIYNRALNELGMTFPGKDQVLWFTSTESEYISQYEEIPQSR
ncbi:MAG: hypothetical protein II688_00395 [Lachnospiraceae bacterium]|jgi:hypothetical protein|nr:hypothetical protein [Lachnospiraceae bacterium]MBR4588351.1 hypothetical protein [Lachnospiraceae bacterium]MCR4927338.1 hypothetical protein [Lachnospiraceae bacterium]